jgi:hypothetical protein
MRAGQRLLLRALRAIDVRDRPALHAQRRALQHARHLLLGQLPGGRVHRGGRLRGARGALCKRRVLLQRPVPRPEWGRWPRLPRGVPVRCQAVCARARLLLAGVSWRHMRRADLSGSRQPVRSRQRLLFKPVRPARPVRRATEPVSAARRTLQLVRAVLRRRFVSAKPRWSAALRFRPGRLPRAGRALSELGRLLSRELRGCWGLRAGLFGGGWAVPARRGLLHGRLQRRDLPGAQLYRSRRPLRQQRPMLLGAVLRRRLRPGIAALERAWPG